MARAAVRDHGVHFHQVDENTGSRIRYQKVSEKRGKEVDQDDIKLSYELGGGKHVVLDKAPARKAPARKAAARKSA